MENNKNMKFELTPFSVKNGDEIFVGDKFIMKAKRNINLIHPYSLDGKNYLIVVEDSYWDKDESQDDDSNCNKFTIYELVDSTLVKYHEFNFPSGYGNLINQIYIPRAVFHNKRYEFEKTGSVEKEIRYSWWIIHDNFDEECIGGENQDEEQEFLRSYNEDIPNYVKYADYIVFTVGDLVDFGIWKNKLHFVKLDKFHSKEFEFVDPDLNTEPKNLRKIIRHMDFSEKNSFKRFQITEIYIPEKEENTEIAVLFGKLQAKENVAKVIKRLLPSTSVYMHNFHFIGMITFLGPLSIIPILEERMKNLDADIKSISENFKVTIV